MKNNPANAIKDNMWDFLKDGSHKDASVKQLKESVYDLISMTTQKGGGEHSTQEGKMIPFQLLDIVKWSIICEAVALVLSGKLDALENQEGGEEDGGGEEL